ncbi:uncharacterized protein LOC144653860 isoform X1 [Oculina patagonica]
MTQLERRVDDTGFTATQQPRLPNVRCASTFNLNLTSKAHVIHLAVVSVLLSVASAKPTNPCTETQFWMEHKNGSKSCVNCEPCPPGQTLSTECGTGKLIPHSAMVICVPCPSGVSFSNKDDTSSCTPCSSCAEDQVVLRNCTSEWDIECKKQCYSKDKYYDENKGDCFPCSKCCGDNQDVVEDKCKEKLGAGSNMVCSFDSSVNRCDQSTPPPQKPTTIPNQSTSSDDYSSPSQGSNREHTVPPTAQPHHLSTTTTTTTTTAKGPELLISISLPLIFMVLIIIIIAGCYIDKAKKICSFPWCGCDTETGTTDSVNSSCVVYDKSTENLDEVGTVAVCIREVTSTDSLKPLLGDHQDNQEDLACSCQQGDEAVKSENIGPCTHNEMSTESWKPLLEEGKQEGLTCSCQQEPQLLCNLLDCEDDLQNISVRLDTTMAGVGNYRAVAQHYGLSHYEISSVLEKHERGPTTALIENLAATKPELTVQEFASVVREKAKRKDVVEWLEVYDSNTNCKCQES